MQPLPNITELAQGIRRGDRVLLSRAITLVESTLPAHQQMAQELLQALQPYAGQATRIGITGVPGVGKSTFIESFGLKLIEQGKKPAILAIDPSSKITKGSILGDKTRMQHLSAHPNAYIRPSPSAGALGGVAGKTRETILLCEAAGFDVVMIETVGVGQSETIVADMVDFFLLLMLAGAGDELQGMKRGIMEMADALIINKADGDNVAAAKRAAVEYKNALHYFPPASGGWLPVVMTASGLTGEGAQPIWDTIQKHREQMAANGHLAAKRAQQDLFWFKEHTTQLLKERYLRQASHQGMLEEMENKVSNGKYNAFSAAWQFVNSIGQ